MRSLQTGRLNFGAIVRWHEPMNLVEAQALIIQHCLRVGRDYHLAIGTLLSAGDQNGKLFTIASWRR